MKKPKVNLVGQDGNIFNLMAICSIALKRAGYNTQQRDDFFKEVTASASYDEALQVIMNWVDVV